MNKFSKTLLASMMIFSAVGVNAAAFQLSEVSTSGLGRAYAGEAAIADNAAVVATNPALMTAFKTAQFSAGAIYIDSKIRMDGTVAVKGATTGTTVAQAPAGNDNVVPGSAVPNMYFVAPINDRFAIGGGMNVNFGLKSEYDANYSAGVFGGKTDLTAINLNLSGAYRVTEGFSVGAGINAVYARAEVKRNAGILDTALDNVAAAYGTSHPYGQLATVIGSQVDATTTMTYLRDRSAWAFGYNLGLAYEFNERNRIGLAYHSKIDIDFKDNTAVSFQQTAAGIGAYTGRGGLILHLPSYLEFSGFHQLTDKFAMHYSYKFTEWSRLKNLHGSYDNGLTAFHKDENYKDTHRFALGGTYDINEKLAVRAGIAYDRSAAPKSHASASIPDTDRMWYSLGATYKFTPNLSADFGFAHLRGKTQSFTETQSVAGILNVEANYNAKASANLYGINVNYSF